jgi:hypothetical protein
MRPVFTDDGPVVAGFVVVHHGDGGVVVGG